MSSAPIGRTAFLKQYEKFSTFLRNELCLQQPARLRPQEGTGSSRCRAQDDSKSSPIASPASRPSGSTSTWTSRCCSGWLCRSPSARSAIPASKSTTPRIIRLLEVLLHGGTTVGGWTAKQIHQAVLTTFQLSPNNLRSESTPLRSAQAQRSRTARTRRLPLRLPSHRQRASRSRCCFCSSTNASADHSPTAASTTSPIQHIAQTANSKPPITTPTRPSRISSICWPPPDVTSSNVEVFLFTIFDLRIYPTASLTVLLRDSPLSRVRSYMPALRFCGTWKLTW